MNQLREFEFYLASQSPRRIEILKNLGLAFQCLAIAIDETPKPDEMVDTFVQRLAVEKALVGLKHRKDLDKPVIAADTAVAIDSQILNKPKDINQAASMLKLLSGRQHQVYTAVCIAQTDKEFKISLSKSHIDFAKLTEAEILTYCNTGEPLDKAGAYGIQGLASAFIKNMEGSYSGVMGLPIYETVQLLKHYGINLFNEERF